MNRGKIEDVRETALKLSAIYAKAPIDYAYIKGWINCLSAKAGDRTDDRPA